MSERFVSATDTYEADAPFAEGASGLAHRATSAKLGRRVFLKQLKLAGTRDWKTVELFEREAQVLAGLDHPAIPRYLDSFRDEQRGSFILVQELIDAPSLQDVLAGQRPLSPEQLKAIVEQALAVLDYLHTRVPPVLHRDISPKNFLFTGDTLFLVDFGAVKLSLRESTVMTSAGTFGYMAPEQILGQALPASDLYGLGMCVVALATGCDPTALPLDDKRGGIDMAQVLPKIPADLRPVVEALVKPGLAERVATAREALALLRSPPPVLVATPPAAPPAPRRSLARRRPVLTALLATTLVYCVYALALSLRPLPGQTGQLGGWTGGHTQLLAQLSGAIVGDYDLVVRTHTIDAIAISPDGALAATSARGENLLWDLPAGTVVRALDGLPYGASWLQFGADGETLWGGANYSAEWIRWHTGTGAVEQHIDAQMLPGAPRGGDLVAVGTRGARSIAAIVRAEGEHTLYRSDRDVLSKVALPGAHVNVALSADGEFVALDEDRPSQDNKDIGTVSVRRAAAPDEVLERFSLRYLNTFALSPDGRTIALFNASGVALHRLGEPDDAPPVMFGVTSWGYGGRHSFSADGSRLAVAIDTHALVIDVGARKILAQHEYHDTLLDSRSITAFALSPDGKLLATGNHDEVVRLWRLD